MKNVINLLKRLFSILEKHRWKIFLLIYFTGVLFYIFVCKADILTALYLSATLFTLNVETNFPNAIDGYIPWLYFIGLAAAFYTITSLLSLLAKQFIDQKMVDLIKSKPYVLVCGLGKKGSAYIDSELDSDNMNIIAVEINIQNPNIEKYREKGIAIIVGDATNSELLKSLDIENVKHILAVAGKDTTNLEIALRLREIIQQKDIKAKKMFIHIGDRSLDKFYKDGGLLDDEAKLYVKIFSMAKNAAKSLFLEHSIAGVDSTYIDSNKAFGLVVVGSSPVALEVIGQICELGHLPNENPITIHCIDTDIKRLKQSLEYCYPNMDLIPNIILEYHELNERNKLFYDDELWRKEITNIMLCKMDAQNNLVIASELADNTYLNDIQTNTMRTKIHIAIYENNLAAEHIDENNGYFRYFDTFSQTFKMASREAIIDEKFELIAKCIHSGYAANYNPMVMYGDMENIERKWHEKAKLTDRDSSRAQAYHIPIKLKALGLTYKESEDISQDKLLMKNRIFLQKGKFSNELKQLGFDDASLQGATREYANWEILKKEFNYFPKDFNSHIEKLIRAEKNRWNAHHYLKGWQYTEDKTEKPIKKHRCIVPIEQMHTEDRFTILYDTYATLYIPNLLAKAGYEIVMIEEEEK